MQPKKNLAYFDWFSDFITLLLPRLNRLFIFGMFRLIIFFKGVYLVLCLESFLYLECLVDIHWHFGFNTLGPMFCYLFIFVVGCFSNLNGCATRMWTYDIPSSFYKHFLSSLNTFCTWHQDLKDNAFWLGYQWSHFRCHGKSHQTWV